MTTGDRVATLAVTRQFDLSDGQWAVLEPLLPGRRWRRTGAWAVIMAWPARPAPPRPTAVTCAVPYDATITISAIRN